jgi:hypothetical protein
MPDVSLILNPSREELFREGFGLTLAAAAFRGAVYDGQKMVPGSLGYEMDGESPIPSEGLWQIPETGVVTLRPNAFRSDLFENSEWAGDWMGLASFLYNSSDFIELPDNTGGSEPKRLLTTLSDTGGWLKGIQGLVTASLPTNLQSFPVSDYGLKWALRSNVSLGINEGFCLIGMSPEIQEDCHEAWGCVGFGERWLIVFGMSGTASLWEDIGEAGSPNWLRRKVFEYSPAGVKGGEAFIVAIVPNGIDGISVVFTQSYVTGTAEKSSLHTEEGAFLYEQRKHGYQPRYDAAHKHYVKTEAGPITLALQGEGMNSQLSVLRIRYQECGLRLHPVVLDEAKPGKVPAVEPIGYYPGGSTAQKSHSDATPGASYVSDTNAAWDSSKDTKIAAFTWLAPGSGGRYTPEIWAMEYEVDATTHTPTTTPWDVSDRWKRITGRISSEPDASVLSFVWKRDDDWHNILKLDGPVKLEVGGVNVFEGKIVHNRPVLIGAATDKTSAMVMDDAEASDMWEDLNDTNLGFFANYGKKYLGSVLEKVFDRCGIPDAKVNIAAELYALEIEGWDRPNDWKTPNESDSAGDVLRGFVSRYGAQGLAGPRSLRIVPIGGEWYAYLLADYQAGVTAVDGYFFTDPSVLPTPEWTDAERYTNAWFKILSRPEFTVRRPRWNALKAYASSGTGDGSDLFAAFVSPHPSSLTDSTDVDYQARVRSYMLAPPETAHATTQAELERIARRFYDDECQVRRYCLFEGEWQPSIRPDHIAMIVGVAPYDTGAITRGDPVSYGAWRIGTFDFQIEHDDSADVPDGTELWGLRDGSRSWSKVGMYTLRYVGATNDANYPMFSETLPR